MTRTARVALLTLISASLMGLTQPLTVAHADTSYPFKAVFEQDLSNTTRGNPQIDSINVVEIFNFISAVVIRINYTSGLSDLQRIELQNSVKNQLQTRWYIENVDLNFIACIPENSSCPPWPGYVIGDLIVGFISTPDTTPPEWPGSMLTASNVGTTSLTLTWTPAVDNVGIATYRVYQGDNLLAAVSGTTLSYQVDRLEPGTSYTFQVEAGDSAYNWKQGPTRSTTTLKETTANPTPPSNPSPPAASWWQYWYLILPGIGVAAATLALARKSKRSGSNVSLGFVSLGYAEEKQRPPKEAIDNFAHHDHGQRSPYKRSPKRT